ncbi:phage replication protein [Azoarcus indigens]|nr:phage replication protein [Azoarcus indigens]
MRDTDDVVQVAVRKPSHGQVAFIDCLRFTIGFETWHRTDKGTLLTDGQIVHECSAWMERIFGFGITRPAPARQFYEWGFELGDGCGYMAYGGKSQNGTMMIVIHGTGCAAAKDGWEKRLHAFFQWAARPCITRIDLAHDCFDGSYFNVDYADHAFDHGWWRMGGRMPWHERVGNWKRPDGSGRTLYIGRRKNGKCCRVYEKGRQLGDVHSEWVRVEVELKNDDRVIPVDALLDPSGYFLGAYDALCVIGPMLAPSRIATKQNATQITIERCVENVRISYGAYIRFLRQLAGDELTLDLIQRKDAVIPDRLKLPNEQRWGTPIHSGPTTSASVDTALFGVFGD